MKRGSTYRKQVPAFGAWLLSNIQGSGLTQGEFARRVGVSPTTVSRWVHGRVPDGVFIAPIAKVLGLDYDEVAERADYRPELPRDELEQIHLRLDPHLAKVIDRPDTIDHIVELVDMTVRRALASPPPSAVTAEVESPSVPGSSVSPVHHRDGR